eukprot:TRINITY_DN3261_c0_g1_i1.p1 TRINITY_DN3261_c0_g1~~TRINITY_DN3261_c0_g1_i1.p1  ORF type:complete len:458 (-),score=66.48 TRINITY_DN3261_c0_g1_i1:156-1529(-)
MQRKRRWDVIEADADVDTKRAHLSNFVQNVTESYSLEVPINDCSTTVRAALTKGSNQERIARQTGTSVTTRGVFVAPGEFALPGDKPLYLHITGKSREAIASAEAMIMEVKRANTSQVTAQLFIRTPAHPAFGLVARILGPNGDYLKHISTSSGAKVHLKGMGYNGPEPLHILIVAETSAILQAAKSLATSLLETIQSHYDSWVQSFQTQPSYPPMGHGVNPHMPHMPPHNPHHPQMQHNLQIPHNPQMGHRHPGPLGPLQGPLGPPVGPLGPPVGPLGPPAGPLGPLQGPLGPPVGPLGPPAGPQYPGAHAANLARAPPAVREPAKTEVKAPVEDPYNPLKRRRFREDFDAQPVKRATVDPFQQVRPDPKRRKRFEEGEFDEYGKAKQQEEAKRRDREERQAREKALMPPPPLSVLEVLRRARQEKKEEEENIVEGSFKLVAYGDEDDDDCKSKRF